ncbi:telethonin-like [Ambystoma mexicanum]|uniref:telethonin-like n=1 Tax=Ambystoma mexicanum TaxID=8296 RepID=UPI0037E8B7F9
MSGRGMVLRSAGMLSAAELSCQVQEENTARREFYTADWKDLALFCRAEKGCSVTQSDESRRETYAKQHEVRLIVQRSPWNIMKLGRLGEVPTEYHLPYQRALPMPIFKSVDIGGQTERAPTPQEMSRMMMTSERDLGHHVGAGLCKDRKPIADITKDLPPVIQPVLIGFGNASLPPTPSRIFSKEAQRG